MKTRAPAEGRLQSLFAALRLQRALFPTERNGLFRVQQYTPAGGPKRAAARVGCVRLAGEKHRCTTGLEIQGELPSRTRYHWKGVRLNINLLRLNWPILECVVAYEMPAVR